LCAEWAPVRFHGVAAAGCAAVICCRAVGLSLPPVRGLLTVGVEVGVRRVCVSLVGEARRVRVEVVIVLVCLTLHRQWGVGTVEGE
jgi:hypothetical protein